MELIHIANATFSSFESKKRIKQSISLENLASKQKTFRIVKEHTTREAPRDHANPCLNTRLNTRARVIARIVMRWAGRQLDGGASRDRTGDLLVANQTLSQLSYGPSLIEHGGSGRSCTSDLTLIRGAL
jgi:hypothetical protein